MDGFVRSRQRLAVLSDLGVPVVTSDPIRIWRLSAVERLRLRDGTSVVFKYALAPFTGEHIVLADLARHGIRVPAVRAATVIDGMLGMILEDLGDPVRDPTEHDAAAAAVHLHGADVPAGLDRLGERDLAALPGQALAYLDQLQADGRYGDSRDLRNLLAALAQVAARRAAGAERPPFGLCHGELHPSAIHIGPGGWRVLDFAMALHGPGLLDLASWPGLRRPADPPSTRSLIEQYIRAGGHPAALDDRGDLPAERWALGWHRVQAAHWLLGCAIHGIDTPDTDTRNATVLRRQLSGAVDLLDADDGGSDIAASSGRPARGRTSRTAARLLPGLA
ncbi:hypothetical protein [Amycolatopsis sp. NPDC004079]|uniref:hypothetical protein n=1 Tax=Amycolatopsis sp. NPDC004079 TaxID=3154549 RepID=UPI00339E486B